jgi:hypothetical protein
MNQRRVPPVYLNPENLPILAFLGRVTESIGCVESMGLRKEQILVSFQ